MQIKCHKCRHIREVEDTFLTGDCGNILNSKEVKEEGAKPFYCKAILKRNNIMKDVILDFVGFLIAVSGFYAAICFMA